MDIKGKLAEHRRIMLDTAPVIYFIEEHVSFGQIADEIFQTIRDSVRYQAFSSVITLIEVLTHPMRQATFELVEKYRNFLLKSANFTIYSIDPTIAEKAAELRAKYSLRTPDAIQIAVGVKNGGSLFITNDKNLTRVDDIEVLLLQDYTS